jgi:ABC-2 type transport system permease protein
VTAQIRSESFKVRTTRLAAMLLLAAAALTLLGAAVEGISPAAGKLAEETTQREMFGANVTAVLLATIAGVVAVTSEFRYGTIRPTLLFEPRRRLVIGAKLVVAAVTGVAFALTCTAASFGAGFAILAARDVTFTVSGGHVAEMVLGAVAASVLGAMIGVAVGALIRNQVNGIVALLAYAALIDATLFGAAPAVGRFLPGKASDALAGQVPNDLLAPGIGGLVYALWTLAFVVAALVRTDRSDVDLR